MNTIGTPGVREEESRPASDYWLDHCEGFQVFSPDGRVGFVELVRFSGQRAEGLVVRTGVFRTQTVFVKLHEVGSVLPRRERLDLFVAPRIPREPAAHFFRELCAVGGGTKAANDVTKVARHERDRELRPISDLAALAASNGAGVSGQES